MAFDGVFLHKLLPELDVIKTGRISKIYELTDQSYIFTVRANRNNYNLMINLNAQSSRIHITNKNYDHDTMTKPFSMFLKKHIEGYFIADIYQHNNDRVVVLRLEGFSEMRDRQVKYLIAEIMGKFSNLILCDEDYNILDSMHHDGVGEFNRIILPNARYYYPESNKLNPYSLTETDIYNAFLNIETEKDLFKKFEGTSKTFTKMVFINDNYIYNFINLLNNISSPSLYYESNKLDFYFSAINPIKNYNTYSEMLDDIYYLKDRDEQIKKASGDLLKYIDRVLSKNKKKLDKLEAEKKQALECENLKLYGELLLSYPNLKEKLKEVTILNYYDNKYLKISLEEKYNILQNSQRYYKKYQKLKKSIIFIDEQIELTNKEINYFELLKVQASMANLNDIKEILDELDQNKYQIKTKNNPRKKKKPNITTFKIGDSYIYVGKNNIQNEYITHTLAKANDLWFHVNNASGSHVVLHKDSEPTEQEIRACANLAAYYSFYRNSSSVMVDYTKIRNIKKIPGQRSCFVRYNNAVSIYIDPVLELINQLEEVK